MVQRSVCLCDGKYIGIESIFTVIDGKQINIPDKLSALRTRSAKVSCFVHAAAVQTLFSLLETETCAHSISV